MIIDVESGIAGNLVAIVKEGRRLLKPLPFINVSDWADENIILPETSVEPGRWRTDRVPHTRGMMDAVTTPGVRQISIMGSSQVAKTAVLCNIIGFKIARDPSHFIVMQPTDNDARDFSKDKLNPIFMASPALRKLVAKDSDKNKDNSTLRKRFVGGALSIVSGMTPRSTRQRSARFTAADDIDALEAGLKEGDPTSRLIKRSTTYPDALNINISTPTLHGASRIAIYYEQSNQMKYFVKCLHCGYEQVLRWENLHWNKEIDLFGKVVKNDIADVKYACDSCGVLMDEADRIEMLKAGRWVPQNPGVLDHYGFWIDELSSTLSSMKKVAQQIVDAGDDVEKMEALYNTVFGLPFKRNAGKEIDAVELIKNVSDYIDTSNIKIPNGVLLLTAGVDVQEGTKEKPPRLEVEVWGWGREKERWLIFRTALPGNIKIYADTWGKLDMILSKEWERVDGAVLRIHKKFIDAGNDAQTVYDYVRGKHREGVFAIKGSNKYAAPMLPKAYSLVDKGRVMLLSLGTQIIKEELFSCLERVKAPGPKFTHFASCFADAEYFRQLTAEHRVLKYIGGMQFYIFEPKKRGLANEALDMLVYNYAAMESCNPNWDYLDKQYLEMADKRTAAGDVPGSVAMDNRKVNNNNKFIRRRIAI